jgi:hypothetical protein
VSTTVGRGSGSDDAAVFALFRAIASRDRLETSRLLDSTPGLASRPIRVAASRADPETYFLSQIRHHVYSGDTALHIASATHQLEIAKSVVAQGGGPRARNRRGAEPLHYAADGAPGADYWDPRAQRRVIEYLVAVGADPDALDNSGVAPLHRAVRTRSSAAVSTLIENGANVRLRNKSGSTPLHLAGQNTGRSDSGSDAAKEEQALVIDVLLRHGASSTDVDAKGKTVAAAASSAWIRRLLDAT